MLTSNKIPMVSCTFSKILHLIFSKYIFTHRCLYFKVN